MNNYNDLILKKPVKYGKITLIPSRKKGYYHMFTGLKNQLELSDSLIMWFRNPSVPLLTNFLHHLCTTKILFLQQALYHPKLYNAS